MLSNFSTVPHVSLFLNLNLTAYQAEHALLFDRPTLKSRSMNPRSSFKEVLGKERVENFRLASDKVLCKLSPTLRKWDTALTNILEDPYGKYLGKFLDKSPYNKLY